MFSPAGEAWFPSLPINFSFLIVSGISKYLDQVASGIGSNFILFAFYPTKSLIKPFFFSSFSQL
jgi:hypothetical protein